MKASKYGMTPFRVFSFLVDDKGRTIEETDWGEFNSLNEALEIKRSFQNEKLIFKIC